MDEKIKIPVKHLRAEITSPTLLPTALWCRGEENNERDEEGLFPFLRKTHQLGVNELLKNAHKTSTLNLIKLHRQKS